MAEGYYKREHLPHFGDIAEGSGELAKKFFDHYGAVFAAGVLTEREKALTTATSTRCSTFPHRCTFGRREFEPSSLRLRRIATGRHCFGCTAGSGSSCGGSLA